MKQTLYELLSNMSDGYVEVSYDGENYVEFDFNDVQYIGHHVVTDWYLTTENFGFVGVCAVMRVTLEKRDR